MREARASLAKPKIDGKFSDKQRAFLSFVLAQYVTAGVEELFPDKLAQLLKLKYNNAISDVGPPAQIGAMFSGFQQYLYLNALA